MKARVLLLGGLVAAAVSFPNFAFAEGIQMLPPLQDSASNDVCLSNQGDKVLSWDGKKPIKCNSNIVVDSSGLYIEGKVGVGTTNPASKLDIAGSVKIGSDVGACTAAKAGAIRWVGSMQYCNGTAWTNLAFAPADPTKCGDGTLVQWDSATNTLLCKPIYEAMSCVQRQQVTSTQTNTIACPAGMYVVAGTCWREQVGGKGTWDSGLFVGDWLGTNRDASNRTHYTCRIEPASSVGAIKVHAVATCCK